MNAETATQVAKTLAAARADSAALATSLSKLQALTADAESSASSKSKSVAADGPSILSLKVDSLLGYTHALLLKTLQRLVPDAQDSGDSAVAGSSKEPLLEHLIRSRLVLEKSKPLENKLRHHIDRLLTAAAQEDQEVRLGRKAALPAEAEPEEDLLAYGPNPAAVLSKSKKAPAASASRRNGKMAARDPDDDEEEDDDDARGKSGVYRPPKLAPVAYDPDALSKRKAKEQRQRLALGGAGDYEDDDAFGSSSRRNRALLSEFTTSLSANPYEQSSSGTGINRASASGGASAGVSKRAAELARMQAYEEENFTRLILNKKEERRRRRDEEDLALGGARGGRGRSGQSAGFEAELGGLLHSAAGGSERRGGKRKKSSSAAAAGADSYDVLRKAKAPRLGSSAAAPSPKSLGGRKFEKGLKKISKSGSSGSGRKRR